MKDGSVQFLWLNPGLTEGFRTGVCLHGHTLHSEECLGFLPRYLRLIPGISRVIRGYERAGVDFARAYWTPPLIPASALAIERQQIGGLGLRPIVSLTDHDNLEAGLALQVTADRRRVPLAAEWTVPYERSVFHLGIHNLPRQWMAALAAYTRAPERARLPELLSALAAVPETLIVLNHPFWMEEGVSEAAHRPALERLLGECGRWIHAFEMNGTRPWRENADTLALGRAHARPAISGGDRHACEPAACLNLTNATSFAEFAGEVRSGYSVVLFMPHYRRSLPVRILESVWDVLRRYPEYPGRERWTDRIFYRAADGVATPLSILWKHRMPWVVREVLT